MQSCSACNRRSASRVNQISHQRVRARIFVQGGGVHTRNARLMLPKGVEEVQPRQPRSITLVDIVGRRRHASSAQTSNYSIAKHVAAESRAHLVPGAQAGLEHPEVVADQNMA